MLFRSSNLIGFFLSAIIHICIFSIFYQVTKEVTLSAKKDTVISLKIFEIQGSSSNINNSKKTQDLNHVKDKTEEIYKNKTKSPQKNNTADKKTFKYIRTKSQKIKDTIKKEDKNLKEEQNKENINLKNDSVMSKIGNSYQTKIITLKNGDERFLLIKNSIISHTHYPKRARQMNQIGHVRVSFLLNSDGLKELKILEKSRYKSLNEAALKAVRDATLSFPKMNEEHRILININFKPR